MGKAGSMMSFGDLRRAGKDFRIYATNRDPLKSRSSTSATSPSLILHQGGYPTASPKLSGASAAPGSGHGRERPIILAWSVV